MRPRISIRGCVRPSVGPSVGLSVGPSVGPSIGSSVGQALTNPPVQPTLSGENSQMSGKKMSSPSTWTGKKFLWKDEF